MSEWVDVSIIMFVTYSLVVYAWGFVHGRKLLSAQDRENAWFAEQKRRRKSLAPGREITVYEASRNL